MQDAEIPISYEPMTVTTPFLDRRGVVAAVAGNALEFYDFLTYTFFAVYIGQAFFPTGNAFTGLLLSLATFGIGFFTRPLGGILIGAYADRAGRRPALMLTISLMTLGTLGLVLTPSYATIGLAGPVILVLARLVQGFALGGEVGPSTAVLLESAPAGQRGFFVSWQSASQGMAILAAGLVGLVLSSVLSVEQLAAWGWRVPFALGLAIVPVGLYVRRRLPETLHAPGERGGVEVLSQLWRDHRRALVLSILLIMSLTVSTYVGNFMTTYAINTLKMPPSKAILAALAQGSVLIVGAIVGGRLSDRFGRKPMMVFPLVAMMLLVYPAFHVLFSQKTATALVTVTALQTALTALSAVAVLAAITELFPNESRSSGLSIAYALSVSLFGGTTQFVVAWLIGKTGNPLSPAFYVIATGAITLCAMSQVPETRWTTAADLATDVG